MNVPIRVIDCVYGSAAVGVPVDVICESEGAVVQQWRGHTGDDGYLYGPPRARKWGGFYTLTFDLDGYFRKLGYASLNSAISVRFHLHQDSHQYGVSILITPSSCVIFREGLISDERSADITTLANCGIDSAKAGARGDENGKVQD
jgi:5-hydroxyisourate hydrolase-like protein (transthyretin family)